MQPQTLLLSLLPLLLGAALAVAPAARAERAGHSVRQARPAPALDTLIDRDAGVKFAVPFRGAKILRGAELDATLKRLLRVRTSATARYTSGVFSDAGGPFVAVWTKPVEGGITQEFVGQLTGPAGKAAALAGLRAFTFDRQALRGEGGLADDGAYKAQVLLQLVRDRVTYVGYYYRTPAQLREFDVVKRSLTVGHLSHLSYETLPASRFASALKWLTLAAAVVFAGAGIGGGAFVAYRRMGRDPAPPPATALALSPTRDGLPPRGAAYALDVRVPDASPAEAAEPLLGL